MEVVIELTELQREALGLPDAQRADLAAEPLASLDPSDDDAADAAMAWADEIERRARRVLSGDAIVEDWRVVRERLTNDLAG